MAEQQEREIDIPLELSESIAGYIAPDGSITGSEYLVKAFELDDYYFQIEIQGHHVSEDFLKFAFYSADTLSECNTETLIGSVQSYSSGEDNLAEVPLGAKLLCIAVQSASDTCSATVVAQRYYQWTPNLIQYKDPETGGYLGNVVGSTPLEVHLAAVEAAGNEQVEAIGQEGAEWIVAVEALASKYAAVWQVINDVTREIITSAGGAFILDNTALDSASAVLL